MNTIALGNTQPPTSNAVAQALKETYIIEQGDTLVGNGKYDLKRCGNVVELNIWNMDVPSTGTIRPVFIPVEYAPKRNLTVIGQDGSGNIDYPTVVVWWIFTNGSVEGYNYHPKYATGQCQLHAVWLIEQ